MENKQNQKRCDWVVKGMYILGLWFAIYPISWSTADQCCRSTDNRRDTFGTFWSTSTRHYSSSWTWHDKCWAWCTLGLRCFWSVSRHTSKGRNGRFCPAWWGVASTESIANWWQSTRRPTAKPCPRIVESQPCDGALQTTHYCSTVRTVLDSSCNVYGSWSWSARRPPAHPMVYCNCFPWCTDHFQPDLATSLCQSPRNLENNTKWSFVSGQHASKLPGYDLLGHGDIMQSCWMEKSNVYGQ